MAVAAHCGEMDDIHSGAGPASARWWYRRCWPSRKENGGSGSAAFWSRSSWAMRRRRAWPPSIAHVAVRRRLVAEHRVRRVRRCRRRCQVLRVVTQERQYPRHRILIYRRHDHRRRRRRDRAHLSSATRAERCLR
jgi:hypothetical protein